MTTPGRIVLIGNEKGGTGKTTVTVTLGAIHAAGGGRTVILDADPGQHSATAWFGTRHANWPERPTVTVRTVGEGIDLPSTARALATLYDLVLIDTGATDSQYLRAGLACAHTMVLPTSTDALELWGLPHMEALMKRAHAYNPDIRLVIAASRIPSHRAASIEEELAAWIAEHTPNLPAPRIACLVTRAAVPRAASQGLGVTELKDRPDPKASSEAQALYDLVMKP